MRRRIRCAARYAALSVTVSAVGTTGCTTWTRRDLARPMPARDAVQVWSKGQVMLVRDVRLTADSVLGRRVRPDSGGVAIPRIDTDSIRVNEADPFKAVIVGSAVIIGTMLAMFSGLDGS